MQFLKKFLHFEDVQGSQVQTIVQSWILSKGHHASTAVSTSQLPTAWSRADLKAFGCHLRRCGMAMKGNKPVCLPKPIVAQSLR